MRVEKFEHYGFTIYRVYPENNLTGFIQADLPSEQLAIKGVEPKIIDLVDQKRLSFFDSGIFLQTYSKALEIVRIFNETGITPGIE